MADVERLTAEDRLLLWPDERWPQEIGALGVLEGGSLVDEAGRFRIEAARALVANRVHLLPRFRQLLHVPRRALGGPLWVDAPAFDIADHVGVVPLAEPGDEAQLLRAVERLHRRRLDRSRPLWEMWFLPGLGDGRVGLFVRIHHVVADGMTGVARLGVLLDTAPSADVPDVLPWEPAPWPSTLDLLVDDVRRRVAGVRRAMAAARHPLATLRGVRAAWPALRELFAQPPGPQTSLNKVIGPGRSLAVVRCELQEVKDVGHAHGATVNDVLLAMTAGGLRALLGSRGETVEGLTLPAYVPVSLHHPGAAERGGNLISQMVVPLPVGDPDPGHRIRVIAAETAQRKAMDRPSLGVTFRSRLLSAVMLKTVAGKRVNVETADLPGPQCRLYFADAALLEVVPLLNLIGNVALGFGALSYAGRFDVLAVGDADAFPDLDVCAGAAREELDRLAASRAPSADAR